MIRVLVVDDSALVRRMLSDELNRQPDIRVVGAAIDAYMARELIAEHAPDVLTLDVEMPRMDGLTFLEKLMEHHPMPVVVVSSITPKNGTLAMRALALGAVEVICKDGSAYRAPQEGVAAAVRRAAVAKLRKPRVVSHAVVEALPADALGERRVVAIGASTGGPRAVEAVLASLPANTPGVLIVQHMPASFMAAFAQRLDSTSKLQVREARDGDVIQPGVALVAPGAMHMVVARGGTSLVVRVKDGPAVNFHKPSVDVTFHSVARVVGEQAVGVLLTGMGGDGAAGLLEMRKAGAHTVGEDESTCVIYGMPRVAQELGALSEVQPLPTVAAAIVRACHTKPTTST